MIINAQTEQHEGNDPAGHSKLTDAPFMNYILADHLGQWFSKCGTRTTSGMWASSSGTQRNLWIIYKLGRVSTKALFFSRLAIFFQLF